MSKVRQLYGNTLQELEDAKRRNDDEEILFLRGRLSALKDVMDVEDMKVRDNRYWTKEDKERFVVKSLLNEAHNLISYLHSPHTYAYYDLESMKRISSKLKNVKSALKEYDHATSRLLSKEIEDLDRKIKDREVAK